MDTVEQSAPVETVGRLTTTAQGELLRLYATLSAPEPETMDGEFDGHLPAYAEESWRRFMREDRKAGFWLGKAYRPEAERGHEGHGYNRYRTDQGLARENRFVWDITASSVDGRPTLRMLYSAFDGWGRTHDLIDEVRTVGEGVYLGIYHTARPVPGFTPREGANGRSDLEVFFLTRTGLPFVGARA